MSAIRPEGAPRSRAGRLRVTPTRTAWRQRWLWLVDGSTSTAPCSTSGGRARI